MYWVYILYSERIRRRYVGQTENLSRRIIEHNTNFFKCYTNSKGPWKLIHSEAFMTREEALKRERYFKSGVGRDWLKEQYGI